MEGRIQTSVAGVGLRSPYFEHFLKHAENVSFLEIHSENFFAEGGKSKAYLKEISEKYPLSFHGVSLSLGSHTPPSKNHLERLKRLVNEYQPALVSEHISWSITDGVYLNDLLPLPYTEEALRLLCAHISMTQNELGRKILMENPSVYVSPHSEMTEGEFITRMVEETGCGLLLDVNNIHVSAHNTNQNALTMLEALPLHAVGEIHLAGHSEYVTPTEKVLVDTHGAPVAESVWQLFEKTLSLLPQNVPTLVEWDTEIPPVEVLLAEAKKANVYLSKNESSRHVA